MSDLTYRLIRWAGYPIYAVSARATVLHAERGRRPGGYLLAANHHGPFDVPGIMAVAPRPVDFLSVVEFRDKPLVGPLFRAMNCVFLDRRRRDPAAVRAVLDRLAAGRVVGLFPEGGIRRPAASVTAGGPFNPGVVRLAQLSRCPIVPLVVLNSGVYARVGAYLPTRSAPVGFAFGEPIAAEVADRATLAAAYVSLAAELREAMGPRAGSDTAGKPAG